MAPRVGSRRKSFKTLQPRVLNAGVFNGFPPFVWGKNEVVGNDIVLLRDFAAVHKLELAITIFPFMGIWDLPARDVVDVAASGISLTSERMTAGSYWSLPYGRVSRSALIRADDSLKGYGDFKSFSVIGESIAHSHAVRHLHGKATLNFIPSIEHGVESLLRGKTDAVGTGSVSAIHQASRDERLKVLDLQADEDEPELISFSLRREKALRDSINDFIILRGENILIDDQKDR